MVIQLCIYANQDASSEPSKNIFILGKYWEVQVNFWKFEVFSVVWKAKQMMEFFTVKDGSTERSLFSWCDFCLCIQYFLLIYLFFCLTGFGEAPHWNGSLEWNRYLTQSVFHFTNSLHKLSTIGPTGSAKKSNKNTHSCVFNYANLRPGFVLIYICAIYSRCLCLNCSL